MARGVRTIEASTDESRWSEREAFHIRVYRPKSSINLTNRFLLAVGRTPLLSPRFLAIFPPAVAKVYIVSFRSHDTRRPSKFIVLADNMKSAINMAWEHGGPDFQSRFDKSTGQAQEMKEGALRDQSMVIKEPQCIFSSSFVF
jgi:hypothetical protein